MARCWKCGKRGLFLRIDLDGLCKSCSVEHKRIIGNTAKSEQHISVYPALTIEAHFTVRDVKIKQRTSGNLLPVSVDAWAGYVSPSGGFINYGRFQVVGINPNTKRKNKRVYEELQEKYARRRAEIDGLTEPFSVEVLPSIGPSPSQVAYAKDLGITIPDGACFVDVSAMISRVIDCDECPADEIIAEQAHIYGIKFSRYHGKVAILELSKKLPKEDYDDFICSIQ